MTDTSTDPALAEPGRKDGLKRSITGKMLFLYVLGDVLGSGIYVMVILSAFKLRGQDEDEDEDTFRASTPLLCIGVVGNVVLLAYVLYDDPASLVYCAALLGVGLVLFLLEYFFGRRDRPADRDRGVLTEV